jgi:hypothetical protein
MLDISSAGFVLKETIIADGQTNDEDNPALGSFQFTQPLLLIKAQCTHRRTWIRCGWLKTKHLTSVGEAKGEIRPLFIGEKLYRFADVVPFQVEFVANIWIGIATIELWEYTP